MQSLYNAVSYIYLFYFNLLTNSYSLPDTEDPVWTKSKQKGQGFRS